MQTSTLYIYLDEGGNFDFTEKGTPYFTLSAVSTLRPFAYESDLNDLRYDLLEDGLPLEYFHASEDRQAVRDRVFKIIESSIDTIAVDSIVVDKRKIDARFHSAEGLYTLAIGKLIKQVDQSVAISQYDNIVVITDSIPVAKKRKAVEKGVKIAIDDSLPVGVKYVLYHYASKSCFGLQVADYCNWAIYRRWSSNDMRSYELMSAAVRSEQLLPSG